MLPFPPIHQFPDNKGQIHVKTLTSQQAACPVLHGTFGPTRQPSLLAGSSPGDSFIFQEIINRKRGNHILDRAVSIPLAHLPRPLTLQKYFSFNLSPQCYKHCSINLFLSSSHKNRPPPTYFSKSWQISTFGHLFFLRPGLPPFGCRHMNNL